ncbi:MAG: hypothetical protein K5637_01155 [Lachnospiraceae bacterium]|nr:hypothetical protein [Lachnospiraceae bacterium]
MKKNLKLLTCMLLAAAMVFAFKTAAFASPKAAADSIRYSGSVIVTLTGENDPETLLTGAVLGLYSESGERLGELTETSEGVYEYEDLAEGTYTILPELVPGDYKSIGQGGYTFSVTKSGETVEIAAEANNNVPAAIEAQQAAEDGNRSILVPLIVVIAAGAAGLIFFKRRSDRKDKEFTK